MGKMARGRAVRRGGFLTWAMLVATVFVAVLSLVTSSVSPVRMVPVDGKGTPPGYPDVEWDRWPDWGAWQRTQQNTLYTPSNWTAWTPSDEVGERARADRCQLGNALHSGGPEMKATAAAALAGTDADRRHAFEPGADGKSPLDGAADRDAAAYPLRDPAAQRQRARWDAQVNAVVGYQWMDDASTPEFDSTIHSFMWETVNFHEAADLNVPQAGPDTINRVIAIITEKQDTDEYLRALGVFVDKVMQMYGAAPGTKLSDIATGLTMNMSADDARMFLQYGGFPKVAPAPGSTEFRLEVEALKARWASCDVTNPPDPYRVLGEVEATARAEWQAELDGQTGPRNDIAGAQTQTWTQMDTATKAMVESLGQAWVAETLIGWQRDKTLGADQRAKLDQTLRDTQANINQQLPIADGAVQAANTRGGTVDVAEQQAAQIAAAAHAPVGRGLAYSEQSATVTKAMIAATAAAAGTARTALAAAKATGADSQALFDNAQAQAHALQAQYRREAAQYAAAVAHAAAQDAASQAQQAAQAVVAAHNARVRAEQAEQAAKTAAADAHAKRLVADRERANTAAARAKADAERAKAQQAEQDADQQQQVAASKRQKAEADAKVAADKRSDAEDAERRAAQMRDQAVAAEQYRNALEARAAAADAHAAAENAKDDAGAARQAADDARAAADAATTAAQNAHTAADAATAAAVAARAAATEAQGAAARTQAAADATAADAATTTAQAKAAHAAAADAIAASQQAANNVHAAQQDADTAAAAAAQARADAAAASEAAQATASDAARAAGWAYAAGLNALGARDAAKTVADSAITAIAAGSPYRETDTSAGLAVLVGQEAKTLAEQQAAAAQAKSDEAARAAQAAADAAARADADAKAAAQAAAAAAADAAAAAQSLQQAAASAAAAALETAAALRADANAAEYNRQAAADAAAAAADARDAAADATAANQAATDAERDAAAAHAAADQADRDAAAARAAADQAERDAASAEAAAARAAEDAREAQDAAVRAETEANAQGTLLALGPDGITGVEGLQVIPHVHDNATHGDCLGIFDHNHDARYNLTHCRMHVNHHITGTLEYQAVTCPDPTHSCTGQFVIDRLGVEPVDFPHEEDVDILISEAAQDILPKLVDAFIGDYVNCVTLKKGEWATACAWAIGSIVVPYGIGKLVRLVSALRLALYTGAGIEEAYGALKLAEIDATTMANLDRDTARALASKCAVAIIPHSVNGRTQVLPADGRRIHPNVGECPVTGIPHGLLGEAATRDRLIHENYQQIIEQVRFINSKGDVFVADFVAQDASGKWIAVETKTGAGADVTPAQEIGYPELNTVGAVLNTSKLERFGFVKGDVVKLPVTVDLWECPSCS
jgi:hypothetical protein